MAHITHKHGTVNTRSTKVDMVCQPSRDKHEKIKYKVPKRRLTFGKYQSMNAMPKYGRTKRERIIYIYIYIYARVCVYVSVLQLGLSSKISPDPLPLIP